jgi:hypothetical protein
LYDKNGTKLAMLLDLIMEDPKGKLKLQDWMQPHAVNLTCKLIYDKMYDVKHDLYFPSVQSITPEFIASWNIQNCKGNIRVPSFSLLFMVS